MKHDDGGPAYPDAYSSRPALLVANGVHSGMGGGQS